MGKKSNIVRSDMFTFCLFSPTCVRQKLHNHSYRENGKSRLCAIGAYTSVKAKFQANIIETKKLTQERYK